MQHLRPGGRQLRAAQRRDGETGLLRPQLAHHPRRMLVARVLAGHDQRRPARPAAAGNGKSVGIDPTRSPESIRD